MSFYIRGYEQNRDGKVARRCAKGLACGKSPITSLQTINTTGEQMKYSKLSTPIEDKEGI
jgi:hypothetical protein